MDAKVLSKWQRQCSRAEYCSYDVRRKVLKDLSGDEDAVAEVMDALIAEKYIDDSRYAEAFARDKAQIAGWGPMKIRFQLRSRQIPDSVIDSALGEIDSAKADDRLRKALETKYKTLKGDPSAKLKLLKFALSRGYGYAEVADAVDETIKNG